MPRTLKLLGLMVSLSLGGCFGLGGYDIDSRGPSTPDYTAPAATSALTFAEGVQEGDMGEIHDFAGAASELTGNYSPYGTSLRLDSLGEGWWVMSGIYIGGDLAGPAFAPGTHRTYVTGTYGGETNVSIQGCSGPSYGNYTFDGMATQITIDIDALGDGNRRLRFESRHSDGAVTTGSVSYRIDGEDGSTAPDRGI